MRTGLGGRKNNLDVDDCQVTSINFDLPMMEPDWGHILTLISYLGSGLIGYPRTGLDVRKDDGPVSLDAVDCG